ncbi:DUF2238 domain-containing protein [Paenibacillus doosanensis]|uniref:DUF2238 domain-containing protein n=1 Tax=Paenibacillus doosanensis TaxID=1229154 RepID=UPI00217F8579|nr:DUF2238 domain-containing protein [Paenibacillus doosanensis]MCS7460287.1 DUF2238 domain-containing protein [Paenibacillus doosanensis]
MPESSELFSRKRTLWLRKHDIPFLQNRPLHIMLAVMALFWIAVAIRPVDPKDFWLESALPAAFIAALGFLYRRFALSNLSYLLIVLFLMLHLTGAHYAYKEAPLDFWFQNTFHTERGISDRIVHFAFGLLMTYPFFETIEREIVRRSVWSYFTAFAVLLACSALFEIVEMLVALIANPQLAAEYLGIQGDILDTQKDMTMALIGSVLSLAWIVYFRYRRETVWQTRL